jgi:hypothetical protein
LTRQRLPKEERKHQIQEVAKGIILEKGYENTTMDEVIEKSGMSTGGVYHYYKSVYEIFYDIMAEGLDYGDKRLVNVNKNINSFVEYQLAKIFDDNEYKALFSILLQGIARNEELRKMYDELNVKFKDIMHKDFLNSEVLVPMLDDEFLVFFIHSLMLGYESFAPLGSKEVFKDNKGFIKEIIISYLKKINNK